jgi:transcriptional regulator NrdR family protein
MYTCSFCGQKFPTPNDVKIHIYDANHRAEFHRRKIKRGREIAIEDKRKLQELARSWDAHIVRQ